MSNTPMRARLTGRRSCSAGPFGRVQLTDAMNMTFEFFRLWTYCEIGGCLPSGVGPSTRVLRLRMSASTSSLVLRELPVQLGEVLQPFPLRGAPWGQESIFVATVVGTSSDRSSRTRQIGLQPCISHVKLVRNPATCARCWSLNDLNREMLVVG